MENELKSKRNHNRGDAGTNRGDGAQVRLLQPLLFEVRKYPTGAEPQQRDRYRQKCKVVEENN